MSAPTRADLAREHLLCTSIVAKAKERADALRAQLDEMARAELERDGTAPTWRIPGVGTVPLALTQPSVDVVDQDAYLNWVHERYPDEIEVRVVYEVRPGFDRMLRESAAKRGAACDAQGEVIPGLVYQPGGVPRGVSVRPAAEAKTASLELAETLVDSVVQAALEVPSE